MSRPIQVIPAGLLGFFNLKNNGQNPVELLEVVQPQLDMRDWYFQSAAEDLPIASIALPNGSPGFNAFTTNPLLVPSDEWWYVLELTVRTGNLAATDASSFSGGYITPTTGVFHTYQVGSRTSVTGNAGAAFQGCANARGFFVPPDSALAVVIESLLTAATVTFSAHARVARLRI